MVYILFTARQRHVNMILYLEKKKKQRIHSLLGILFVHSEFTGKEDEHLKREEDC